MKFIRSRLFKFLFNLGCLLVSIWLAISLVDLEKKKGILASRLFELDQVASKNAQLKEALVQAETPEFIERQARDKLGLVKPGETVIIMNPTNPTNPTNTENNLPRWKQWLGLFF